MTLRTPPSGVDSSITIALPTYGRPDALCCAVRSVLRQTRSDWSLIVVGDACGDDTAAAMAPFLADSRIRYINLTSRCGEQALPNSAVMALARSEFMAFLNHDDLWLPEHLELACKRLQDTGADFFMGRSAWIRGESADPAGLPEFACISEEPRTPERFFLSGLHYVEPVSAWVITRSLAERVGPWHRAMDLFRAPIQEWAMRAWRSGARLLGDPRVTCVKFENHWGPGSRDRKYDTPASLQSALITIIEDAGGLGCLRERLDALEMQPDAVGRGMQLDLVSAANPKMHRIAQMLLTPEMAGVYLNTGLDAYSWYCAEVGLLRGWRWREALRKRTGEERLDPPDLAAVIEQVSPLVCKR